MNLSEREKLIRELPEGDFTRIADKKSEEMRSDYDIRGGEIGSKKTAEEIIAYLKNSKFTMTYGYALKRLVINKFKLPEDTGIDEIAEILYREFKNKEIPILNRSAQKRKPSKNDEINGIKSWLSREESDKHVDRRKFLQGISFALSLSDIQVSHFLRKELGEEDYNFRDAEEVIIFYCHYNGLCYAKYAELLKRYDSMPEDKVNNIIHGDYSVIFSNNFSEYFSDDDSLLRFLEENKSEFIRIRQSAIKQFRLSWYKAIEKTKERNKLGDINVPVTESGFYRNFCEYLPAYEGNKATLFSPKGSALQDVVSNPLNKLRVAKLLGETNNETSEYIYGSAKISATKKDLVTLEFYILCMEREIEMSRGDKVELVKEFDRFRSETDIMLYENGFFKLYPANKFDNLVMLSLMNTKCWEYWTDVLEESFWLEED